MAASHPSDDVVCSIARHALASYLKGIEVLLPEIAPQGLEGRAGAFVTWSLGGVISGSMGTISPIQSSAAREIAFNAFQAGVCDPRFEPLDLERATAAEVTIDVLRDIRLLDQLPHLPTSDECGPSGHIAALARSGMRLSIALPGASEDGGGFDALAALATKGLGTSPTSEVAIEVVEIERFGAPMPALPAPGD